MKKIVVLCLAIAAAFAMALTVNAADGPRIDYSDPTVAAAHFNHKVSDAIAAGTITFDSVRTEVTCTSDGLYTFKTSDDKVAENLGMITPLATGGWISDFAVTTDGHVYKVDGVENWVYPNGVAPTCSDNGTVKMQLTCVYCGNVKEEKDVETKTPGHDWAPYEVLEVATCAMSEHRVHTCKRCGVTEDYYVTDANGNYLPVNADNHIAYQLGYESCWKVVKEPTCGPKVAEKGLKEAYCPGCRAIIRREIPELIHTYEMYDEDGNVVVNPECKVVTKVATCLEKGKWEAVCERCGNKAFAEIDKDLNNHLWGDKAYSVTPSTTCEGEGTVVWKCVRELKNEAGEVVETCTTGQKIEKTPALGHIPTEVVVKNIKYNLGVDDVCYTYRTYTFCTRKGCEHTLGKDEKAEDNTDKALKVDPEYGKAPIKVGHTYGEWTIHNTVQENGLAGYATRVCAVCKDTDYQVTMNEDWESNNVFVKEPSCFAAGYLETITYNKKTHAYEKTVTILPAIGHHTYENGICVICGEINEDYTGICYNKETGAFEYVTKGVVDKEYKGTPPYDGEQFFVENGTIAWDKNGITLDEVNNVFYFASLGRVCREHTGLALYGGKWFMVEDGVIDVNYAGFVAYDGGLFYVACGRLVNEYTGLAINPQNPTQAYYVYMGQVDFGYTGKVEYNGAEFDIVKGELVK